MESFKKWLMKEMTDTGQVAHFARPIFGVKRRMYPPPVIIKPNVKKG